jgi:hypothetical protein
MPKRRDNARVERDSAAHRAATSGIDNEEDHDRERGRARREPARVQARARQPQGRRCVGRPLYDVTNEAISQYLSGLRLGDPLAAIRRAGRTRR